MAPETHLLLSWIIAAKTTDNPRDRQLVTLAGILPDVDGLGLLVDFATEGLASSKRTFTANIIITCCAARWAAS